MSDYIGGVLVPDPGSSGAFPLTTQYPWSFTQQPEVIVHTIANSVGNLKIEQRYYLGPRAKRFLARCSMNETNRAALVTFWNDRKGAWQGFDYAAPNEDGSHTHYNVRFADEPLSVEHLAAALSTSGVWLIEVPDPAGAPTYTVASTLTRLTVHDDALDTALRAQVQEIIPLIKIQPRESGYPAIYLSDRRVTVATQLYQARLLDWAGIAQSIGGSSDLASFTFGNADRVMTLLANDTNLQRASVEFSLFHVSTTIKLNLWKGEITDWTCDEGPEFKVSASDGLYELNLPYPARKIDRKCWKKVADGINCMATGPTTCLKVFLKTTGETGNDCTMLAQTSRFGGVNVKPQSTGPQRLLTLGDRTYNLTQTSIVNDSAYGGVLPEIYTDRPMPVAAQMAAGRDESEFYTGLGIVGRGPLGSYATTAMVATADGGQRLAGHTLDGQAHHGFGTANPTYGLRTSLGDDPTTDNFTISGESPASYAAGTAWIEIRRTDIKGIHPTKTSDHQMQALIATGLKGWTWTAPASRSALSVLSNPVWVAVNMALNALGLERATAAQQEAVFDCAAAIAAAAVCNETPLKIIPADGNTETQFVFVGVLGEQKPFRDWLQEVLNNSCGYYLNSFGKLKIGIRYNSSTVSAFTTGNILLNSLSLRSIKPAFNWLSASFGNSEYDWKTDSVTLYDIDHAALIGAVTPVFNQAQINLVGTCTKSQAARIVTMRLREELGGITAAEWQAARQINFRTTVLALDVEAGMVASLTHPDMPGGLGEFRITGWRLNRDWSIDIEGRTTTDSMYDLTVGTKPADIVADPLPGELVINTMPGDVSIIEIDKTDDGLSMFLDVEYEPPGTSDFDIGTFSGVETHIEAPDASGYIQAGGGHDYDGNPALVGTVNTTGTAVAWVSGEKFPTTIIGRRALINSVRYLVDARPTDETLTLHTTAGTQNGVAYSARTGKLRLVLALPETTQTWRIYLASKSEIGYVKKLVLYGLTGETPSHTVSTGASEIVASPAPNQTWVTSGANETKVAYVTRGNITTWQFKLGVLFDTNASNYEDLAEIEFVAIQTSPVSRVQVLGYGLPPAHDQGTVQQLWDTDDWVLPVGANDIYTLEMRCKNAVGAVTANPPQRTGLTVNYDTGPAGANLTIPPVTGLDVTNWGIDAIQQTQGFRVAWTNPSNMANVYGFKIRIATPGMPAGQDVTGTLPFPAYAASAAVAHIVNINRNDIPPAAENWTFKVVTINAAQDGDNLATAPTDVIAVSAGGVVPDLIAPLLPSAVSGADIGNRAMFGSNETGTWLRATVTLPTGHRAQWLILWFSDDGGTTWTELISNWGVDTGTSFTYDYFRRVPATNQTDYKFKATTGSVQVVNAYSTAVVSVAFPVDTLAAPGASLITNAVVVGALTYATNADGISCFGGSYSWTNPTSAAAPEFFHSELTTQKVDASGNPAPDFEGVERAVDGTADAGAVVANPFSGWAIPSATAMYKYFRLRLYVLNRNLDRILQTTAWTGAAYITLAPTEQVGVIRADRLAPATLGPEFSTSAPISGGTPVFQLAQTNLSNVLPNGDFQLVHPTTASWVDKWTAYRDATRQTTGMETGQYLIRLGYDAAGVSYIFSEMTRVSKGQRYSVSVRAKADATPGGYFGVCFRWYSPARTFLSQHYNRVYNLGTAWETVGLSASVPTASDAYYMLFEISATPTNGKYYYVDRAEVTLVTVQQDEYSAGVTTAVTLGQHLNPDSQFVGVAVQRSTGWSTEQRDDHWVLKCPSGRVVAMIHGADATVDFSYLVLSSDANPAWPMTTIFQDAIICQHDATHGVFIMFDGSNGRVGINGTLILGPQGAHVGNPSGGATVDAEARTAINSILSRLETHGLLASS